MWSPRVTKKIGQEQLGSGKINQTMGIQISRGPLNNPQSFKKWAPKGQELSGIKLFPWNPSVTLTHQPLQSSVEYDVQVSNEKFGSMDP